MLPHPESAYFVIADISGYTSFLAGVELDHAQDIIADLMDTVVKGLRPPFRLAKFEGDAAFVYAAAAKIDGSMLQDTIEQAYFAFRRRLRDIKQSSICECKACAAMGDLDFKFVAHHGEMVKQKMGGREELAGRDVIVVHRLLKNTVSGKVGDRAYALYSDACLQTSVSTRRPTVSSSITRPSTSLATSNSGCAISKRRGSEKMSRPASRSRGRMPTRSLSSISPRRVRRCGNISPCQPNGRNGGPPTHSSISQPIGAEASAARFTACTARTRSSKSWSIGVHSITSP
jgi:hypothetical protein